MKEEQIDMYAYEVEMAYFPKKEALEEPRKIEIIKITKSDYGFIAHVYAGFCGDRQLYISNTQYNMLKANKALNMWIKAEEKGLNKKKKMEYSAKISVDKENWF